MKSSDYRVLITGAGGLLGKYLVKALKAAGIIYFGFDRVALDITELESLRKIIRPLNLTHIINCAAYTNVAKAEVERDLCYKVNVLGVQNLVEISNQMNIELIQISTDYVFDGMSEDGIYYLNSKKNPLNYYGLTKSLAEDHIIAKSRKWKIIRTSWLFGRSYNNFVNKIIQLSLENNVIFVNNIEIGIPTFGLDLAWAIITKLDLNSRIYHITNSGSTSRYLYAKEILELTTQTKLIVDNVLSKDVIRPMKVILSNTSELPLRHWTLALADYLLNCENQ